MRLKVVTTAFVVIGLLLLIGWPFFLGERPGDEATRLARAEFASRLLIYFAVTCFVWLSAAFCAVMLMRQTRKEFLEEERDNVKELIEGMRKDHQQKAKQPEEQE